ncbi:hypothetical protein P5V15_000057 [Pogonomyrmex californicus]
MRCFESFFKHTWRPQQVHQMDSPAKFEPTRKTAEVHRHAAGETTELGEVRATAPSSNVVTSMPSSVTHSSSSGVAPCRNGGCKIWRSSRIGEPQAESPWHSLKTVFLLSVIVAFLIWIVVYTLLDQYRIL